MTIELNEPQLQAVKNGEVVRVAVPELGEDVVLLTAAQYEHMREALDDQHEQEAVLKYSMKQAAKVAQQNPY
jgi:PHD/YefM family antitoxin component YafN of YafNO toxin-antitoxin module